MEYSQPAEDCQPEWRTVVDHCLKIVHAVLWRPTCVLCNDEGHAGRDLCKACETGLALNLSCCRACAQPISGSADAQRLCGACLRKPPHFGASFVPYRYQYPLDRLLQRLKYGNQLSIARVLGELFAQSLFAARSVCLPDLIVPVPLAIGRFRARGYNQAIELAQHVARRTGVEMRADTAVRTRETPEQAALARKERRRNVRGAFRALRKLPPLHIALFDDVMTTGSTANELAKVLRRAGAKRIDVWAIARAGK